MTGDSTVSFKCFVLIKEVNHFERKKLFYNIELYNLLALQNQSSHRSYKNDLLVIL